MTDWNSIGALMDWIDAEARKCGATENVRLACHELHGLIIARHGSSEDVRAAVREHLGRHAAVQLSLEAPAPAESDAGPPMAKRWKPPT